jgi:hypothetical protein
MSSGEKCQVDQQVESSFEDLKIRWENFIMKFREISPIISNIKNNVFHYMVSETRTKEKFVEMAENTRPFVSKELWNLMEDFMEFMRNLPDPEGANYREVYNRMSPANLIKRLLTKRPIVFLDGDDDHVLRSEPMTFVSGEKHWNEVAKRLESSQNGLPNLRDYISYDEMLMSACINMSTPTFFVSDGSLMDPFAKPSTPFILEGILCGLVGARLEKIGFLECRFVFPRESNDSESNLVHRSDEFWIRKVCFEGFPEGKVPTSAEIQQNPGIYEKIYVNGINVAYLKKRVSFSVIPFIQEAIHRGREAKRMVVVSVPPIGAGVWRGKVPSKSIVELIITAVLEYLDNDFDLLNLEYLAAIFLPQTQRGFYKSFLPSNKISRIETSSTDSSITIHFKESPEKTLAIFNMRRYVAQLLPERFSSCLNIAGYAWDGNSYPGNEYWIDSFSSFDPQAVLCSNLGQFQNPEVNVKLADAERIRIY